MQAITIIRAIEDVSGLSWAEILHESRKQHISDWRHIAIYYLRFNGEMTTTQVAAIIKRDHSTITHAVKKINQLRGIDVIFTAKLAAMEKRLTFKSDTTIRPWRTPATYERAMRLARPSWYRQRTDLNGRDISPIMTARTFNRSTEVEP